MTTIQSPLMKAEGELSNTQERLHDALRHLDQFGERSVFGRQFTWLTEKIRMISKMLETAIARAESTLGLKKQFGALESFASSVSVITRYVDEVIIDKLQTDEVKSCIFDFDRQRYPILVGGAMLSIEARISDLEGWAKVLGLTSAIKLGVPMPRTEKMFVPNNRIVEVEEESEDVLTVGLEEDVQVVTSRLIGGHGTLGVVAIVGTKRIGKTTLARKIYKNPVIARHFPCRAWVTLPRSFQPTSVLLSIAKQVGGGFTPELEPMEKLRDRLYRLWRYKRYLIVLDDVSTIEDWMALYELFPVSSNGSRLLITSPRRDIIKACPRLLITSTRRDLIKAGPNCYIHERRALSDEEAWELFNAKLGFQVNQELGQLARQIVKKTLGFPLAILEVGDFLSKKGAHQEQWIIALSQINYDKASPYLDSVPGIEVLSSNVKQCLLCFRFFRENEIPARRLIVLWVAEGLVNQTAVGTETPEFVAEKLLTKLVHASMIQVAKWKVNGKVKTCRMNHLLIGKLLSKAEDAEFLGTNLQGAASTSSSSKGIVLRLTDHLDKNDISFSHIHGNDRINDASFRRYYGRLLSFLSFDPREGPLPGQDVGNFIHRGIVLGCFKMVRVIDLEGTFRPKLPDSIGKLTQLRYLGLRRTYTELLPASIGKCLNLQTLDLKHTCLRSLPGSIWKLQQLRHVYLSESYRSRILAPESSSSLFDIQTLWGAFVDDETRIEDGLNRLISLRKLGLVYRLTMSKQVGLARWISKLNHVESLRLRSIDKMIRPSELNLESLSGLNKLSSIYLLGRLVNPVFLHELPESLTEITLSVSGIAKDPMQMLDKLPSLRILNLYSGSYTGNTMVCSSGGFPLLRVLNLWKLEELEEWHVEEGSLTILRHLEIRSCNNLKMIPEGLKRLEYCRVLKLTNMPDDFKARVTTNQGQDWYKIAHVPSVVIKN